MGYSEKEDDGIFRFRYRRAQVEDFFRLLAACPCNTCSTELGMIHVFYGLVMYGNVHGLGDSRQ